MRGNRSKSAGKVFPQRIYVWISFEDGGGVAIHFLERYGEFLIVGTRQVIENTQGDCLTEANG